jgi:cob(I)alamin adenosyltransferase
MLHEGVRNFIGSFLAKKVKPDIVVKGACDAYRAMIDTRVLETDKEGLLFVINRGLYDYDLDIAVKGYKPVKVKSRMFSVVKKRLRKTR